MKIIAGKEKDYTDWRAKNTDPYGNACFVYAEAWADLLEKRIPTDAEEGKITRIIVDNAKSDSHTADTEGITGFMYGMAVSILSKMWIYGEQLRRWHNLDTQIGTEGEEANKGSGVLNPALLNVSTR